MSRTKSLREKLLPAIFLASVFTIGLFALLSQIRLRASIRADIVRQMERAIERANQSLDMELDKYHAILYDICTDDSVIGLVEDIDRDEDVLDANSSQLRRVLSHVCNRNYEVNGLLIRTAGGETVFYDGLAASSAKSQWISQAEVLPVERGERYSWLSEPAELGNEKIHMFQITRRLVDYRDIHREVGTVVMSVSSNALMEVIQSGDDGQFYLCDGDQIINSSDPQNIGGDAKSLRDSGVISASVKNERTGWKIVGTHSLTGYKKTLWEQAGYQLVTALGMVGLMWFLVHTITRPVLESVDQVVRAMNAAECGDFSVRIPIKEDMPGEVQRISLRFNEMMSQIDRLLSQVRQAVLEQKNAELSALEAQIDPHFLYNTLDTINWKAIENEQYEISEMVGALADILRYAVLNAGAQTTVGQEISWLNQYIFLQGARLGRQLKTQITVPEEVKGMRIHKLLIQPFVENSIKHGFYKKEGECALRVLVETAGDQLHIVIEDNGKGIPKEILRRINSGAAEAGEHLGIANVRKRLELYYGDRADVYYESRPGRYTRVHLFIPAEKGERLCGS